MEPASESRNHIFVDSRSVRVDVPAQRAFTPIRRIGGETGWYYGDWLWKLRGGIDLLFGGPGMRRGRPHPDCLRVGDALDCWRVEVFEPDRRLQLALEMKVPGRGFLEFEVVPNGARTTIRQTATFEARGLLGTLYWYAASVAHDLIFAGMLRRIAARASNGARPAETAEEAGPA